MSNEKEKVPVGPGTENPKNKVCVILDTHQVEIIKLSLNHSSFYSY